MYNHEPHRAIVCVPAWRSAWRSAWPENTGRKNHREGARRGPISQYATIQPRHLRTLKTLREFILLLLLSALLPACGLKGPLYLPAQAPAVQPPAATNAGNTPADDKKSVPAPVKSP